MTANEVKDLPMDEKMQIMEILWDEFRERFENADVSDRVKELLDNRRERVNSGAATLLDWDSVKSTIGRS